jgi:hypothetical protein
LTKQAMMGQSITARNWRLLLRRRQFDSSCGPAHYCERLGQNVNRAMPTNTNTETTLRRLSRQRWKPNCRVWRHGRAGLPSQRYRGVLLHHSERGRAWSRATNQAVRNKSERNENALHIR